MGQFILLLDQAVSIFAGRRRFDALISFLSDKEKVEVMIKENAETLRGKKKMFFGLKLEDVVAKSITSENKSRELFGNFKEQRTSSKNKDSRKQQPFLKAPIFRARGNGGKGVFSQDGQSI